MKEILNDVISNAFEKANEKENYKYLSPVNPNSNMRLFEKTTPKGEEKASSSTSQPIYTEALPKTRGGSTSRPENEKVINQKGYLEE